MIVFQLAAVNIGYRMFGKGFKMNSYENMNPAGIILVKLAFPIFQS